MPRYSTEVRSRRSISYTPTSSTTMPAQLYLPLVPPASIDWQTSYDHAHNNIVSMQPMFSPVSPSPHIYQHHNPYFSHHQHFNGNFEPPPTPTLPNGVSGPWSAEDDNTLQKARSKNMAWAAIQKDFFPNKTSNACRKRHERLMLKKRGAEWDESRSTRLAEAYRDKRQETWSPLAQHLGERWEHVEKTVSGSLMNLILGKTNLPQCMEQGLKNILSLANSQSRGKRQRQSKNSSRTTASEDPHDREEREDSGISFDDNSPNPRSRKRNPQVA